MFLISPRRYGKTSLLRVVMNKLIGSNIKCAYIDLYVCNNIEKMAAEMARALSIFEGSTTEKAIKFIKEALSSLRPKFTIDNQGEIGVVVDMAQHPSDSYQMIESLLSYVDNYTKKHKKKAVILFDEFQEISRLGGEPLEKLLRAVIQKQKNVGYVFSGSKKHVLVQMVNNQSRAFYGMGPTIGLEILPDDIWIDYISVNFNKKNIVIDKNTIIYMLEITRRIPYFIQSLAHELWDMDRINKVLTPKDINNAVNIIIEKNTSTATSVWDSLSPTQRGVLEIFALKKNDELSKEETLREHNIRSIAAARKAIDALINKGIIDEDKVYFIENIWFFWWVTKYITKQEEHI